jgi:class 3 adenylate cyclase
VTIACLPTAGAPTTPGRAARHHHPAGGRTQRPFRQRLRSSTSCATVATSVPSIVRTVPIGRPRLRAGLHTDECEVRGDDIGGIAVHIGACVSALAGPNEVLVSSTLRDLVIGSGLGFEERGAHQLKGVPGEWRLFAVASP